MLVQRRNILAPCKWTVRTLNEHVGVACLPEEVADAVLGIRPPKAHVTKIDIPCLNR